MMTNALRKVVTVMIAAVTLVGVGRVAAEAGSAHASGPVERVASVRRAPVRIPQATSTTKAPAPTTTTTKAPAPTTTAAPPPTPAPTVPHAPTPTTPRPPTTTVAPAPRPAPAPAPAPVRVVVPVVAPPVAIVSSGLASATEADMLARVNAVRATGTSCGGVGYAAVPALVLQATLIQSAAGHAVDMATHNYFSHTGLNGSDPGARITAAGYRWQAWAENIAAGQPTAASVVAAWFASAGHCENFMSPTVSQIGFALATNSASTYGTYWVADLGRPG